MTSKRIGGIQKMKSNKLAFAFFILCTLMCMGIAMPTCQAQSQTNNLKHRVDSIERELYKTLSHKLTYEKEKVSRINRLKVQLQHAHSPQETYQIQKALFKAFETYQIDSAIRYITLNQQIAQQLNDKPLILESSILLAGLYSYAGRFIESNDMLKSIPRSELNNQQLIDYYQSYSDFYSHYGQSSNYAAYFGLSEHYRDSLIQVLPKESLAYRINIATKKLFRNQEEEAEKELKQLLGELKENQRERAVVAYLIGLIYKQRNDLDNQIYYFGISAITDIKNSIRENASLQSLALAYFEKDNIDMAYIFIQKAMEDAIFCNVRFRTVENSSFYPIINSAFQEKESQRKNELKTYLYVISVLSLLLLIVFIIVYQQMKRLKVVRKDLKTVNETLYSLNDELLTTNKDLQEANHIKEEYMAQFFEICSSYIDKLDSSRKGILKKLANKHYDELNRELKSQDYIKTELEDLYHHFDIIFLNLYPTFIQDFNKLLKEEERIVLKPDELLNSELRIFALIRLGISDSTKIARFLRYSLRTVYNYRVKVRNKVVGSKDNFEENIKSIGNLHV